MKGAYVGDVSRCDPLYGFLYELMWNVLGMSERQPTFAAFRQAGRHEVYGYRETSTGATFICKFYGPRFGSDPARAARGAQREYDRLETLRAYGLVGSPHHVIRPLGCRPDVNAVLALEHYSGEDLSQVIAGAIQDRHHDYLYRRLTALASFLATLHHRTANGCGIDFTRECTYLDTLAGQLKQAHRIQDSDVDRLTAFRDRWRGRPRMWEGDQQVWLHGDATPANFLFGEGMDVAAIDLERLRRGDRVFDLGRVVGELQHAFLRSCGDRAAAEPFIGHFLWEYSCHFPDRDHTFSSITARLPYYMALNMLRIARNDYLGSDYSDSLIQVAYALLQAE